MSGLQPVRGTHDLLPEDSRRHRFVEETAFDVAKRYGYGEIVTPIFEFTEVFSRTLGETSDVVTKEMYTFADRSGDSITLRPEGTAGVARAFISGGLTQSLPLKVMYRGPMFRHERPQKGRLRQFHQVGCELLGVDGPQADIEVISMAWRILAALGLSDKVQLEINTLGDAESRAAYRAALIAYLEPLRLSLSEESQARLQKNPLRVLDSKDEEDKRVVANAPLMGDSLTPAAKDFFDQVTAGLTALGIPFVVNPKLVRGLDYYCHTAFEFTTTALGAQGTVLAGGRYDGLIGQMGGPATPGIGWAAGIERLSMLVQDLPQLDRPISIIPMGDTLPALVLADRLRAAGLSVDMGFSGNMKKRMARANKANARFAVILGEDELARGAVTLRDLDAGTQEEIPLDQVEGRLTGA
ncbi:Histidyl-tRNA synthetase [Magnetospirillum gryphiswaldense MSR-1 v2]|uniref:Histidine--tRNA ligase n=1 Tax=Magnetospirillum gryphiswaldense (strain DSM 6361 / JCM 21280 / NBRC 15271 / MSR-1) TaxID=431944 RepID=V6F8G6_MAGGM|nr:histidine--tRNA ligase [Magnetospirillum gryphiswaldense]CDL00958.1 Histidyl-tRNA synthetase [Magnetospirillum gryphiswaldense MSR-1 v2]